MSKQNLDELLGLSVEDEGQLADDSALHTLRELAQRRGHLIGNINALEQQLRELQEELDDVEQVKIPELMGNLGINKINVNGIGEVSTKLEYRASVTEENWPAFRKWMEDNGMADVMKENTIIVNLTDAEKAKLQKAGFQYEVKPGMHWQTLSKIAREIRESGDDEPASLSVFTKYKTVVK